MLPTMGYDIFLWPPEHLSLSSGIFIILLGSCSLFEFSVLHDECPWWHRLLLHRAQSPLPYAINALCNKRLMPKSNLPGHAPFVYWAFFFLKFLLGVTFPRIKAAQGSNRSLSERHSLGHQSSGAHHYGEKCPWTSSQIIHVTISSGPVDLLFSYVPGNSLVWNHNLVLFTCLSGPQETLFFRCRKSSSCK